MVIKEDMRLHPANAPEGGFMRAVRVLCMRFADRGAAGAAFQCTIVYTVAVETHHGIILFRVGSMA